MYVVGSTNPSSVKVACRSRIAILLRPATLMPRRSATIVCIEASYGVPMPDTEAHDVRDGPGFRSWLRGSPSDERRGRAGGVMLEGGAEDADEAWRWFLERAGHGDIVVLRATPDEGYDQWLSALTTLRSFQTLQLTERTAADDPFVCRSIERADGLFIAGGDQFDYVQVWTGTPIQRAVNAAIAAGVPVGGISGGLAV